MPFIRAPISDRQKIHNHHNGPAQKNNKFTHAKNSKFSNLMSPSQCEQSQTDLNLNGNHVSTLTYYQSPFICTIMNKNATFSSINQSIHHPPRLQCLNHGCLTLHTESDRHCWCAIACSRPISKSTFFPPVSEKFGSPGWSSFTNMEIVIYITVIVVD